MGLPSHSICGLRSAWNGRIYGGVTVEINARTLDYGHDGMRLGTVGVGLWRPYVAILMDSQLTQQPD